MPRFHFDFRHGDDLSADTTGVLLGSVEEAYLEAVKGAHGIWGELLKERRDPRRCAFEVRTNEGLELFVLPLTELLDSCVDRQPEPRAPLAERLETRKFVRCLSREFAREVQRTRQILEDAHSLRRWANGLEVDGWVMERPNPSSKP